MSGSIPWEEFLKVKAEEARKTFEEALREPSKFLVDFCSWVERYLEDYGRFEDRDVLAILQDAYLKRCKREG